MSDELKKLRASIDALDQEMLELINRRAAHARSIGQLKNGAVYRPEREAQILRRIKEANPGPLSDETVARLFREIMSACLALEKPMAVSYLGPQGTFSEAAAVKHFGHAAHAIACISIDEVMQKVEAGEVDYAVAPVENSTEGAVGRTLDLMLATPLKICGEVVLRVHQHLLGKSKRFKKIKRVYSHAQSFAQCHEWLNRNLPGIQRVPVASNAEAARLAGKDTGSCAIAGDMAAERYRLNILTPNIEDEPNNTTRFWILGAHDAEPSGKDKTSLVMSSKNVPGAVHQLLTPLARHGVSMSKLESRPSRTGLWEYVFFVDIEGHQREANVAKAIAELGEKAAFLKILGSYPAAVV
ncbi:MAG TPA: prephenate dehydratase [Burkholderiales bacterium]|nr:prephenate dehydratase [Burkholderiales bacterium]